MPALGRSGGLARLPPWTVAETEVARPEGNEPDADERIDAQAQARRALLDGQQALMGQHVEICRLASLRPVTKMKCSMPASRASSTTC